jgi:hypothetical protein
MTRKKSGRTRSPSPEMVQVRQGDVFLRRIGALPVGAKPIARDKGQVILAYGEVTGHSHRVVDKYGTAQLYQGEGGVRYMTIDELTEVVHEEHGTVTVEPGVYELPPQMEWDDSKEPRQVAD